jgi:predicted house-cleaning noncanonical NTP pyrophosphatase (MazG superfamily)
MPTDATADRFAAVAVWWRQTNAAIGDLSEAGGDPYRLQALLDARAHLWHELAAIADAEGEAGRPAVPSLYAVACHYAAILDQEAAAAVRYEHRIPTPFPRSEAGKLHLRVCAACGRPWQRSTIGACSDCPRITFGRARPAPRRPGSSRSLIRDRVPVDDGGRLVGHVHRDERIAYLFAKLHEEADEAREAWLAGGEGLEFELADCWEVLLALAEATGVGRREVYHARQRKILAL